MYRIRQTTIASCTKRVLNLSFWVISIDAPKALANLTPYETLQLMTVLMLQGDKARQVGLGLESPAFLILENHPPSTIKTYFDILVQFGLH